MRWLGSVLIPVGLIDFTDDGLDSVKIKRFGGETLKEKREGNKGTSPPRRAQTKKEKRENGNGQDRNLERSIFSLIAGPVMPSSIA